MSMYILHKYRRGILIGIVAIVGVPMCLFFGMPNFLASGSSGSNNAVVAMVGSIPLYSADFRDNLNLAAGRQAAGGVQPTFDELATSTDPDTPSVADSILQQMIDGAFISIEERARAFEVDQEMLVERIKRQALFQDENGVFNPVTWNVWVTRLKENDADWNQVFNAEQRRVSRTVYMNLALASAGRVLDSDLERRLEERSAKIKVKYAQVAPKATPTEEEIQAQYNDNQALYKKPDTVVAEYVAVSLEAPRPDSVDTILQRALETEDFAALADEVSDRKTGNGGDIGWRRPGASPQEYLKPIYDTPVGQITDATPGPDGYYLHKVEEERTHEDSGEREVRVRQIFIRATLSPEERSARTAVVNEIIEQLKGDEAFQDVAAAHGLALKRTGPFTNTATEIENFPQNDLYAFRGKVAPLALDVVSELISGRENLYVARVVEREAGVVPPLDEIRDDVIEGAIASLKRGEEYKARITEYAEKIKAEAATLAEVAEKFPEIDFEIKETKEFTQKDYLYQDGIYLQTAQIYEAVGRGEPGTMGGPLIDILGGTYFVELVTRTEPEEIDKTNWDIERKQLREAALLQSEAELLQDYLKDLRERSMTRIPIQYNFEVIDRILGRALPNEGTESAVGTENAEAAAPDLNALNAEDTTSESASSDTLPGQDS